LKPPSERDEGTLVAIHRRSESRGFRRRHQTNRRLGGLQSCSGPL